MIAGMADIVSARKDRTLRIDVKCANINCILTAIIVTAGAT